jgi:hypothetical protein
VNNLSANAAYNGSNGAPDDGKRDDLNKPQQKR